MRASLAAGCGSRARGLQYWWRWGSAAVAFGLYRVRAQKLWHTGVVAPRFVESSWTRDQTWVPCTGKHIISTVPPGKSFQLSSSSFFSGVFGLFIFNIYWSIIDLWASQLAQWYKELAC